MKQVVLGIYARISRDKEEGKDRSIDNQIELGIAFAQANSWEYKIYQDIGLSGTLPIADRPSFDNLLEAVTNQDINAIWAIDLSRFERNLEVRIIYKNILMKNKCAIYTDTDGEIDLYNDEDNLYGNIMSSMNAYHTQITRKKVKKVLVSNAKIGKVHGTPPLGYEKSSEGKYQINEFQASIVKRIYNLCLEGNGAQRISNILNNDKVPTPTQINSPDGFITTKSKHSGIITKKPKTEVKWNHSVINKILKNRFYIGERTFQGQIFEVPRLLDDEIFKAIGGQLAKNKNNSENKTTYDYLLKGLIVCGKCGRNYVGRKRLNKPNSFYTCQSKDLSHTNCGNESIEIKKIESFVWDRVIGSPIFIKLLKKEFDWDSEQQETIDTKIDIEKAKSTIDSLRKEREQYKKMIAANFIDFIEGGQDIKRVDILISEQENKIKEFEKKLNIFKERDAIISDVEKFQSKLEHYQNELPFEIKRKLVQLYIKDMMVNYDKLNELFSIEVNYYARPYASTKESTVIFKKDAVVDEFDSDLSLTVQVP